MKNKTQSEAQWPTRGYTLQITALTSEPQLTNFFTISAVISVTFKFSNKLCTRALIATFPNLRYLPLLKENNKMNQKLGRIEK